MSADFRFGRFLLMPRERRLYADAELISLEPRAFDLLILIVEKAGRLVSKDELFDKIWPGRVVEEGNLHVQIAALRKVLGKDAIDTVSGRGYRFAADVERIVPRDVPVHLPSQNLPPPLDGFVGRESDLRRLAQALERSRLVTLTGVGGVGKTTLAHMFAHRLRDEFADGVHFIELAAIADPGLVLSTIAALLGVKESGGKQALELLIDQLRERVTLLVLDNFEQIISAAPEIERLLAGAPRLKVVVTSRVRLQLQVELEYAVPSLAIPSGRWLDKSPRRALVDAESIDRIRGAEAVRLFISRAQKARPAFELTDDNAGDVAQICARLDGLPLAIELAAARIRVMSPSGILARLDSQLSLLTGGANYLPVRQQTMRGIVAWSYDLLDEAERALFRRLSVFAGDFAIESAEAICGAWHVDPPREKTTAESPTVLRAGPSAALPEPAAASPPGGEAGARSSSLDGIESLLNSNLLVALDQPGGEIRFRMLEVVREFAQEALVASGETAAMNRRHALHFLALAREAEPHLRAARSPLWLNRLEDEHGNLRAALHWAGANAPDVAQALAAAIWRFWWHHGHIREGREQAAAVLSKPDHTDARARTRLLLGAAFLNRLGGDFALTRALATDGLALARETGDEMSQAFALYQLGLLLLNEADFLAAGKLLDEGLAHARSSGDTQMLGLLYNGLGEFSRLQHDYTQAEAFYRQALAFNREAGDLARQTTNLINLGATALARNDPDAAGSFYRDGLDISSKMADMNGTLYCLEGFAGASLGVRDPERAAVLFGAAEALREANDLLLEPSDRAPYEQSMALVRRALTATAFADLFKSGRRLGIEEAVALALTDAAVIDIGVRRNALKR